MRPTSDDHCEVELLANLSSVYQEGGNSGSRGPQFPWSRRCTGGWSDSGGLSCQRFFSLPPSERFSLLDVFLLLFRSRSLIFFLLGSSLRMGETSSPFFGSSDLLLLLPSLLLALVLGERVVEALTDGFLGSLFWHLMVRSLENLVRVVAEDQEVVPWLQAEVDEQDLLQHLCSGRFHLPPLGQLEQVALQQ